MRSAMAARRRVEISVAQGADGTVRVEVTDDGIGMAGGRHGGRGDTQRLGLIGMRERVMAMAGSLAISPGASGAGLAGRAAAVRGFAARAGVAPE